MHPQPLRPGDPAGGLRERIRQGGQRPEQPLPPVHYPWQQGAGVPAGDPHGRGRRGPPLADPPLGDHPDPAAVEAYEEERRLFYVAMTRAKEELFLFRFRRSDLAPPLPGTCSPTKPAACARRWRPLPQGGRETGPAPLPDLALFDAGAPVTHRAFGRGEVVSRQGDIATILFQEKGEKKVSSPWPSARASCGAPKEHHPSKGESTMHEECLDLWGPSGLPHPGRGDGVRPLPPAGAQ